MLDRDGNGVAGSQSKAVRGDNQGRLVWAMYKLPTAISDCRPDAPGIIVRSDRRSRSSQIRRAIETLQGAPCLNSLNASGGEAGSMTLALPIGRAVAFASALALLFACSDTAASLDR